MKIEKGLPGYVKEQQKIRTVRTVLLLAAVLAIFGIGLKLNGGSRRSIYSIIAALGCIPFAMSGVGMCMMWMRRPAGDELVHAVQEKAEGFLVLYELYITTREHSLFLDAAAIRGNTVTAYSGDAKASAHIPDVRLHLQRAIGQVRNDAEVRIFCSREDFFSALDKTRETVTEDPESEEAFGCVLKALSL